MIKSMNKPMSDDFYQWLESASAVKYLNQEKKGFEKLFNELSGQMGIQLSLNGQVDYLSQFNLSSQYLLYQKQSEIVRQEGVNNMVVAGLDDLPFKNNQFSVVVAPRLTLLSNDSHSALREIYRVTANEGYLAISGINPVSLIGFQSQVLPKYYPLLPSVGLRQMKVWLSLLGFNIIAGNMFHYSAMSNQADYPVLSKKIEKIGTRWLPIFAGGYWLLAKKQIFGRHIIGSKKAKRLKTGKIASSVAKRY